MPNKILRVRSFAVWLAAGFMLLVPLAPDAVAYRDVCMRFPAGVGFTGRFRVEYGDAAAFHRAPIIDQRRQTWRWEVRVLEAERILADARGRSAWSTTLSYDRHACVPLDMVRKGEHFAVLLQVDGGFDELVYLRYCRGWDRGKALVFSQNPRDTRRLMLDARRAITNSECWANWVR